MHNLSGPGCTKEISDFTELTLGLGDMFGTYVNIR